MHVPNRLALFDGIYIFRIDALIVPNTLLHNRFVGAGKITFQGWMSHSPLIFAAKNSCLQERIRSPPLKIDFYGRGDGLTRP